jgi:penicillin-binding protein 1A
MIEDVPIAYGSWRPSNFDGRYRGPIPLRDALVYSVNTVAVRLLDQVGVDSVRHLAQRLGVLSPLRRDLGLALGTSEVNVLELVTAYTTIANGGRPVLPHGIREIRDSAGKILYQRQGSEADPVLASEEVQALTEMMVHVIRSGTGKAARLPWPAAGKTGTSQDFRDAWFIGFTETLVTGVWVGNDDNSSMREVTGGGLPALIWRDFMTAAGQGAEQ